RREGRLRVLAKERVACLAPPTPGGSRIIRRPHLGVERKHAPLPVEKLELVHRPSLAAGGFPLAGRGNGTLVSLTVGRGPFGKDPAGRFNVAIDPPGALLFWDPVWYRIRALL